MVRAAERGDLLARQARALEALTSDEIGADVFDRRGHAATRELLVRKRVALLARHWPVLQRGLGDGFGALAREYALTRRRLTSDGRVDGRAFVAWLRDRGALPDVATAEVMHFDVSYRTTTDGARLRRLPTIRLRCRPCRTAALSVPRPGPRLPFVVVIGGGRATSTDEHAPQPDGR